MFVRRPMMSGVLGTRKCMQICIIVKDAEEKKKKWAEFLGMPVPPLQNGGPYYITGCVYDGKPEAIANCEMGFFQLTDDISIECLQPRGGVSSEWQNFLNDNGEGLHHFAFNVKHTEAKLKAAEEFGIGWTQKGKYSDGSGMYAYLDSRPALKATIELLETFRYDD
jgi:methylmalonyl-CoA/ethylmalonyl-CoA epimerase